MECGLKRTDTKHDKLESVDTESMMLLLLVMMMMTRMKWRSGSGTRAASVSKRTPLINKLLVTVLKKKVSVFTRLQLTIL